MFRFCDSFDHYSTAQIVNKWTAMVNSGATIVSTGRNGQGMSFNRSGIGLMPMISKTLDYQAEWYTGFAFLNDNAPQLPHGVIFACYNNYQLLGHVDQEVDGTLTLVAGNSTVIANAGSFPLQNGVWYYIEIHFTCGTTPNIALKLNGNLIASGAKLADGVDPSQFYAAGGNRLTYGGAGPTSTTIDDLYICDGQTPGIATFLGDVRIDCIFPRDDVDNSGWTPSDGGSDFFPKINEHIPDNDTTYVYSNTINSKIDCHFDHVASFAGTIPAVHFNVFSRKDDEGYRAFKSIGVQQNSLNANRYINDSYNYQSFPDDSGWTPSSVNGTLFGVQIVNP